MDGTLNPNFPHAGFGTIKTSRDSLIILSETDKAVKWPVSNIYPWTLDPLLQNQALGKPGVPKGRVGLSQN